MFFALAASMGCKACGGDAVDVCAHSPPPDNPTFVSIDDAYCEWYLKKCNVRLNKSDVLPVLHALQGHPESGKLWERHINDILQSDGLAFQHTTHDCSISSATIDGHKVLLLRQVDDFAMATPSEELAKSIYDRIGKKLQLPSEKEVPFKYLGLLDVPVATHQSWSSPSQLAVPLKTSFTCS